MNKSLIASVVMSVYNESEELLSRAIDSICRQTFTDFEFVIVDDNPDSAIIKSVLHSYATVDQRIRIVFNRTNLGLVASLNRGVAESKGQFIFRMDADDWSAPDRLHTQLVEMKKGYCFTAGLALEVDGNGKNLNTIRGGQAGHVIHSASELLSGNYIVHPTVCFKKEDFEAVGGYREIPSAEDYDLWCRLLLVSSCGAEVINDVLLKYTVRANSISISNRMLMDQSAKVIKRAIKNSKTLLDFEQEVSYTSVMSKAFKRRYDNLRARRRYNCGAKEYEFAVRKFKGEKSFDSLWRLVLSVAVYPRNLQYIVNAITKRL